MMNRPMHERCWTCRKHRVVCDAGQPSCLKCDQANRECLGYSRKRPVTFLPPGKILSKQSGGRKHKDDDADQKPTVKAVQRGQIGYTRRFFHGKVTHAKKNPAIPLATISLSLFEDSREHLYFQFFHYNVLQNIPGSWCHAEMPGTILLQAAMAESTLRYAVSTLGGTVRRRYVIDSPSHHLKYYNRAISAVHAICNEGFDRVDLVIVLSYFFAQIEFQMNHANNASVYFNACARLADKLTLCKSAASHPIRQMAEMIADECRLRDVMSANMSLLPGGTTSTKSLVSPLTRFGATASNGDKLDRLGNMSKELNRVKIVLVERARRHWPALIPAVEKNPLCRLQTDQLRWILSCEAEMNTLLTAQHLNTVERHLCHIYYMSMLSIKLVSAKAVIEGKETEWDTMTSDFANLCDFTERILEFEAKSPLPFSTWAANLGFTSGVFLAAWKCRDPSLRRKGVQLLKDHRLACVPWLEETAKKLSLVAVAILTIEERGLEVHQASDIPEYRRIGEIEPHDVTYDAIYGETTVRYSRRCSETDGNWRLFTETV